MGYSYLLGRIKNLAEDIKDAKAFDDEHAFNQDLRVLRYAIQDLGRMMKENREDSAFFDVELTDEEEKKPTVGAHVTEKKKEDSCDAVKAFKERRKARKDSKCIERFKERRQKRLDAKDDDGQWITTENNHKIHLNEEGVPDKGNPFVVQAMNDGNKEVAVEKKEPVSKRRVNQKLDEIVKSDMVYEYKIKAIADELDKMRTGTMIKMPDSWADDDGKVPIYKFNGRYWESEKYGTMASDDFADYIMSDDEAERPRISHIPRDEESRERSRRKREENKHYAMMPDGSVNGHYTSDFKNDHVSQDERDEFSKRVKDLAFQERGYDEERALYRGEANKVGDMVTEEIKRRAKLRKGDTENAPYNDNPQVEDIYDALRDMREFGKPEGFKMDVESDIDEQRTNDIIKEAMDRFPSDWFKDCTASPRIVIVDGVGRAHCTNGRHVVVYTKQDIGDGTPVEQNDRGMINQLAHELGHYVEANNEKVRSSVRDCFWGRALGSEMIDVEPGYKGYTDSFFNYYMGKIYPSGDTEILSVLMENIGTFDPFPRIEGREYDYFKQKFGRKKTDKESLGYILGVLAGL